MADLSKDWHNALGFPGFPGAYTDPAQSGLEYPPTIIYYFEALGRLISASLFLNHTLLLAVAAVALGQLPPA